MKLKADRLKEAIQIFDTIPNFATYQMMMSIPSDFSFIQNGEIPNSTFFVDVLSYLELLTEMASSELALKFCEKIKKREINAPANDNQQYVFDDESITFKHVKRGWKDEPKWIITGDKDIPEIILIREYLPRHFYEQDLVWITEAHFNFKWARRLKGLGLEEEAQETIKAIQSSKLMRKDGFLNCSYRFKRGRIESFHEIYSRANVDYTNTLIELGYLEEARDMIRHIVQSNLYQENGLLKNYAILDEKGSEEEPLFYTNVYWAATIYKAGFKKKAMEVIQTLESEEVIDEDGLLYSSKEEQLAETPISKIDNIKWIRCLITMGLEERAEKAIESIRKKGLLYDSQTDYTKPLNLKSQDIEIYSNWTMALLGIGIK